MYIQRYSVVPRSVSGELEGVRLCPGRFPWLRFRWSLPQRHATLPTGACLSAPARGLRVNPREWSQVVCIRFISVPFRWFVWLMVMTIHAKQNVSKLVR